MRRLFTFALLVGSAFGQVIQVTGGDSTLYQGAGGQALLYFPSSTALVSGGVVDGHAGFGAADSFKTHGLNVTVGDHSFAGSLESLGGVYFTERGIAVERNSTGVFVGSTGVSFGTPFVQTMKAQHVACGFFTQHKFGNWKVGAVTALSGGTHSAAGSVTYTAFKLKLTAAGGMLSSRPIAAGSVDYHPVEPLRFIANQQNLFVAGVQSTVDSASVFAGTGHFSANVGAFRGVSGDLTARGVNAGAGLHVGPISEQSGWFESAGHAVLFHALTESSRHWSVTENVSQSRGQTSFSGGGTYHTNRVAVSLSQGIGFSPSAGFVHTTSITISLRVRDAAVTVAANALPGSTRWSAYGSDFAHGPMAGSTTAPGGSRQFHSGGKLMLAGRVKNTKGQPVEGVAVALAATVVYSDSKGDFSMRTNAKRVTVTVLPEDFIVPGKWQVVSAPEVATADALVEITVEQE